MSLLAIESCTKRFSGLTALSSVTLSVESGEIVGLIGPNGSGKTTLFNVISGFLRPEEGTIIFDNFDITRLRPYKISRIGISRTFQVPRPFGNVSVFHNILVGAIVHSTNLLRAEKKVKELLVLIDLEDKSNVAANKLTIGDRKRLEIAKALSVDPKLLLLDEVMAGLTPTEVTDTLELIKRINEKGVTLIVIEHNMRAIMSISERIIVLNHGEKIAEGVADKIVNDNEVIKAYLGDDYAIS